MPTQPQDAEELRGHLAALDWSSGLFADAIHEDKRLVRRWVAGTRPIPEIVLEWLRNARNTCPNMDVRRQLVTAALGDVTKLME